MPHTQLLFRDEARAKLPAGAALLADTLTEIEEKHEEPEPVEVG